MKKKSSLNKKESKKELYCPKCGNNLQYNNKERLGLISILFSEKTSPYWKCNKCGLKVTEEP